MSDSVNFAIIGCGRISDLHAPGYLKNPKAQLAAVCDIDEERARARAREWDVPLEMAFTDYSEVLKMDNIDAV
ncbi:MAG: Gfo/Idh/MocA family oxidoreductase, partial [Candidatus Thorarchaeota archaeon]